MDTITLDLSDWGPRAYDEAIEIAKARVKAYRSLDLGAMQGILERRVEELQIARMRLVAVTKYGKILAPAASLAKVPADEVWRRKNQALVR